VHEILSLYWKKTCILINFTIVCIFFSKYLWRKCYSVINIVVYVWFVTGCGGVVTFGLTAAICSYVACMVFQRKTDFEFETGLVLMPDNILPHKRRILQLFSSKL